jgi:hypothetical protein
MDQFTRRVIYVAAGVVPAVAASVSAFLLGLMQFWTPSSFGIAGLIWAAIVVFPVPHDTYKRITPLLVLGLVSVVWFSVIATREFADGLFDGTRPVNTLNVSLLSASLLSLIGPAACAFHFLRYARRTPNNSFKSTPLRGAP